MKMAIFVDGAFYQKRAFYLFGRRSPEERANEMMTYCDRHVKMSGKELYRIFYYDCPPSEKTVYHPLLKENISLKKTPLYEWTSSFHSALLSKRKLAFRRGELLESSVGYSLKPDALKRLCLGLVTIQDLSPTDFYLDIQQKGVDIRIGLDIATIAQNGKVDQMILIAGDSDFVPAAKYARREGVDFILDPLWYTIRPNLNEHIDGLRSCTARSPFNPADSLHQPAPAWTNGGAPRPYEPPAPSYEAPADGDPVIDPL
jgi:uncharacterized LabA/DUF88 family protein